MGSFKLKWNIGLLVILVISLFASLFLKLGTGREMALAIVGVGATIPVVVSAVKALKNRKVSMDLLAGIALIVSLLKGEWESAVFINLMITSARIFGEYTAGKARVAIKGLLKLRPQKVKVKKGDKIVEEAIGQVRLNDWVVIETGDRIPVDGEVVEGEASVDQSSLTGESMPVARSKGDKVYSSTLNVAGSLLVRAEKIGKDTTFEKVVNLVEEAQSGKSRIQTQADKFASWYILVTMVGAVSLYFASRDLTLVLAVLLVTCADDIAVAIPMAFWAAIGQAARRGIIIKGGNFLEGLANVKTLVVDKTGTLTAGTVRLEKVVAFRKEKKERVLKLAAMAESVSEHPIAKAIVEYAKKEGVEFEIPENFRESPGKGVVVFDRKDKIVAGSLRFLKEQGYKIPEGEWQKVAAYNDKGFNVVVIGYKDRLVGAMASVDELRPGVKETIGRIRAMGVRNVMMLTGDNERVASRVAKELGIVDFRANLLPDEKLKFIKEHLSNKEKLAMVGDGVNDAASLAAADIGIAMGTIGSDAAIEAADVALMQDDFRKVSEVMALGRYTSGIARQDLVLWGVINTIGLGLVFGGVLGPGGAAVFNFVTDFLPLLNSLRLFKPNYSA